MAVMLEKREEYLDGSERGRGQMETGMPWPFHTKGEPDKVIHLWTDLGQRSFVDLAQRLTRASIHPVEAYFNYLRRRVSGFERASQRRLTLGAYGMPILIMIQRWC